MENVGLFYDPLVHFTAIENILWPFGIFLLIWYFFAHLVYFSPFWYFVPRKSGNPVLNLL
jgi:hypothetical protein